MLNNTTNKTLATIGIAAVLGAGMLVLKEKKVPVLDEVTTKASIETLQSTEKIKGEYKQIHKEDAEAILGKTEYETEVNVYDGQKGKGYIIIFHETIEIPATTTNGTVQITRTKSIGYGPEAQNFTHDWQ